MATVDILMTTYNAEEYVSEQIESLLWQDYTDWQLLISDDCSSDRTLEILEGYTKKDSRISIASKGTHFGSAKANFMHLMEYSKAPYAMFCDHDDVWLQDKIQKTLDRMHELEKEKGKDTPLLVLSDMVVVDENLQPTSYSFTASAGLRPDHTALHQLVVSALGAGCTFMMNKPLVELSRSRADVEHMVMHDWWVTLCAAAFGAIGYIDEPLSLYRQHGDNTCGAFDASLESQKRSVTSSSYLKEYQQNSTQARAFRDAYADMLSPEDYQQIDAFISVDESKTSVEGLARLTFSKAWKPWPYCLGQVVAVARQYSFIANLYASHTNRSVD